MRSNGFSLQSFADVDECLHMSNLCENGECVNNDGSYRCKCKMGYKLDATGKKCVGKRQKTLFTRLLGDCNGC